MTRFERERDELPAPNATGHRLLDSRPRITSGAGFSTRDSRLFCSLLTALKRLSSLERSFERYPVRIFEVAAHWDAIGDAGHFERAIPEELQEIVGGGFAFAARIGCDDYFPDIFGIEASEKLPDADLFGTDSVEWREDPLKHVVASLEGAGLLDSQKISGAFHDADFAGVSRRVGANAAQVLVREVEADRARSDLFADLPDIFRKRLGFIAGRFEKIHGDSRRALFSKPRQSAEFADQVV